MPTFRDPEFLYATVPIAIWSEVEMGLAIIAGSLPTLRPLYRIAAQKFSWKTNFFSNRSRSYKSMDPHRLDGTPVGSAAIDRNELSIKSYSESERKILNVDVKEFVVEGH